MGSKSIEWESQRARGGNSWLQQLAAIVIPKLDNVVKVETVLSDHVEPERAERERVVVSSVQQSATKPRSNVQKEEFNTLSALHKDERIVILEADQGNATVVMDT